MLKHQKHCCFFLLLFLFLTGCSRLSQPEEYLSLYHHGQLPAAEKVLSETIEKEIPAEDYRNSKNSTWLLLDRATTRFASGDADNAIHDYQLAVEALDYYNQNLPIEVLGTALLRDDTAAYQGSDFEQILARVYFALALLQKTDFHNALALLKQADRLQQEKRELYSQTPFTKHYQISDHSFAKYLFGVLLEHHGDLSNAAILYRQAEALTDLTLTETPSSDHTAVVIIICHNGNAPRKISEVRSSSIASAAALEILLASHGIDAAASSFTGISVPALYHFWLGSPVSTQVALDNTQKSLITIYNVSKAAEEELQQKLPLIAARGIARFLIRRSIVAYAQKQDPCLGMLTDIGMLIANAHTEADTRSWHMLPHTIDLARYDVIPGTHDLSIQVNPPGLYPIYHNFKLCLEPHSLCVINVFNIHPGVTTIQVPPKFLIKEPL